MRNLYVLVLAIGLIGCLPGDAIEGQLIRIFNNGGGVDIRVPFVRVQTDGYGGSYVRAPFVQVQTPPPYYGGYQPYYTQPGPVYSQPGTYNNGYAPAYPPGQPAGGTMNGGTLNGVATEPATTSPPSQGTRPPRPSGNTTPVPAPKSDVPKSDVPESGKPIPPASDSGSPPNPPELKSVLSDEPAADGVPGLRQQLLSSAGDLNDALSTYSNAQLWQDYLKLPAFVRDEITWMEPGAIGQDQLDQLTQTVERFERTAGRSDMKLVNQFESFSRVRRQLNDLLKQVSRPADNNEELPPPREVSDQ